MTLTFYDGLGDRPTVIAAHSSLPSLNIKNRSIILDAPPCRLPLR